MGFHFNMFFKLCHLSQGKEVSRILHSKLDPKILLHCKPKFRLEVCNLSWMHYNNRIHNLNLANSWLDMGNLLEPILPTSKGHKLSWILIYLAWTWWTIWCATQGESLFLSDLTTRKYSWRCVSLMPVQTDSINLQRIFWSETTSKYDSTSSESNSIWFVSKSFFIIIYKRDWQRAQTLSSSDRLNHAREIWYDLFARTVSCIIGQLHFSRDGDWLCFTRAYQRLI